MAKEKAFWVFFTFGIVTVLLSLGGAAYTFSDGKATGSSAIGFLLLFLGASLAVTLGSLLFIRSKSKR